MLDVDEERSCKVTEPDLSLLEVDLREIFGVVRKTRCRSGKIFHLASRPSGLDFSRGQLSIDQVGRIADGIMERIGQGGRTITIGSKADYVEQKIWDEVDDRLLREWQVDVMLESLD